MAHLLAGAVVVASLVTVALSADTMPDDPSVRLPVGVELDSPSVVVEPGDHLWKISATHLAEDLGREATDSEIWPYWREVIVANTPALRSGDPDLIYPGEVISLPPR